MASGVSSIKSFLSSRHAEIRDAHRNGATGFQTCAALSQAMDEAIRTAFSHVATAEKQERLAVVALGGYGRNELCPCSDIDVMILCEAGATVPEAEGMAMQVLHWLWDAGLDVGHSVRTLDDAIALKGESLDAWTSMMESRFLCGNVRLADRLYSTMAEKNVESAEWFVEGVLDGARRRRERHGNSVKLLEPNVKKSAGGLRDFHAIVWLYRYSDPRFLDPTSEANAASIRFLTKLRDCGEIYTGEMRSAANAIDFLLRTRNEMHYRRSSMHDALEYMLQREVAAGLGYGGKEGLHSVEVFMREYYLHARTIYRLHERLSHKFIEILRPHRTSKQGAVNIRELFLLHEDGLGLVPGIERLMDGTRVLEAFCLAAEHNVALDVRLQRVIEKSHACITDDVRHSAEAAAYFKRILGSHHVAPTLRAMNDLGVLGQYIPEFDDLVAFFQHNVYHYFTADEHTLIAVANAEHLREQRGILREVFRNLRHKETLFVAVLLHDIAKPRGVADHEIVGVEMAKTILHRLHMDEAFADVAFLIRNHLVMEQVAFRRNIHDAETIKDFAARFERPEQLDYLYLLTYADLSAVNINVWTEWKASLLQELYQRTTEVLRRNLRGSQIDAFHQSRHMAAVEGVVEKLSEEMPRDHVQRHLESIQNDSYIAMFTDEEIREHIRRGASGEEVSTLISHQQGYTEVTIVARDAPFALSKFCAVLAANDANIFDANVFTRDDGIIIDRFRVSDAITKEQVRPDVCWKIDKNVKEVMGGKLDIDHLFQAHRRRWKRRPKAPVNPHVRRDVQFEDNPRYTIIDVYAPDSLGFLYRVTETISKLGLDIYFAKIATRVDGIVDAFYTLDRMGDPVTDSKQREAIRTEIMNTIDALSEQELS